MASGRNSRVTTEARGQGQSVVMRTLDVIVGMKILHAEDLTSKSTDQLTNEWISLISNAVIANSTLTETVAPNEVLAVEISPPEIATLTPEEGEAGSGILLAFPVQYQHYRDDMGTAPGVTQLTE